MVFAAGKMKRFVQTTLAILLFGTGTMLSQESNPSSGASDPLQQHFKAARSAQAAGDLNRAHSEYVAFLSLALHRLGDHRANAGDFKRAVSLFEEALPLTPDDFSLRLDYAAACLRVGEQAKAKATAEKVLEDDPGNAQAHFLLGRIELRMDDAEAAKQHLETAVQLDPTYEHGYELAQAYLKLRDPDRAQVVFSEMEAGFGDTAPIHMEFGRAYAEAGYPERSVPEFKKAIAKDDRLAGVHYSLGAAYLLGLGDAAFPDAAAEFRIELKNHPDDLLSLFQLGSIALSQHNLEEAEQLLSHAAALDPTNPDSFLGLGQVYVEQNRQAEAEKAFRESIALTSEVSRNHYQVQRAHYQLGRLLSQIGRPEEARQELKVAEQLLKESVASNQGREPDGSRSQSASSLLAESKSVPVRTPNPEAIKEVEAFEEKVSPALADAYNSLGVIAVGEETVATAAVYFQRAATWNPSLEGIDFNLAKASFSAGLFAWAVPPLTRSLKEHPEDTWTRSALGSSLFRLERYREAVQVLHPLENEIERDPRLNYIYAVSLIRAGQLDAGMVRLQGLAKEMPRLADVHAALGEGFVAEGNQGLAAEEFRLAAELNPKDANAKYRLGLSLIALHKQAEAEVALADALKRGIKDAGAYYELGKLQLEKGDAKQATSTLQGGTSVDPENVSVHCELAKAYLRSSEPDHAKHESEICEELRKKRSASKEPKNPD